MDATGAGLGPVTARLLLVEFLDTVARDQLQT